MFTFYSCKFDLRPGTTKNKLFSEYDTKFRYVVEIQNGLDGVSVATSISIPRFIDLHINPIHIRNCSLHFSDNGESFHNSLGVAINKWCAKTVPYMEHLKKTEKYYMERFHDMLEEDFYATLPELKPHVVTRSRHGSKRGFGVFLSAMPGLITLAVESINTYLYSWQEKCILDAVNAIRQDDARNRWLEISCSNIPMISSFMADTR